MIWTSYVYINKYNFPRFLYVHIFPVFQHLITLSFVSSYFLLPLQYSIVFLVSFLSSYISFSFAPLGLVLSCLVFYPILLFLASIGEMKYNKKKAIQYRYQYIEYGKNESSFFSRYYWKNEERYPFEKENFPIYIEFPYSPIFFSLPFIMDVTKKHIYFIVFLFL